MVVHVALLAVPAVAGGFLQAFQFAFLLWPLNLALPLARHLPRACILLRSLASLYADEVRRYVNAARRGLRQQQTDQPPLTNHHHHASASLGGVRRMVPEEVVAHAMMALVDISY